jgi:hypothetical protein
MKLAMRIGVCAGLALGGAAMADPVSFHLMQIEQVVGGVSGDVSAQAVQLRMRSFNQNFLGSGKLMAYDATGANPIVLIDFDKSVPNGDLGDRVLIVTEAMKNYTDPPVVADFIFTNPIPESYLASGRIAFESSNGAQKLWALHTGGDSYTGPTEGALDNDDDGDFGPPFDGAVPTDGAALKFGGGPADKSSTNQEDYALTDALAVLTNNAGDTSQVVQPPDECYPDCNADEILDFFDFLCFLNAFDGTDQYADCEDNEIFDFFDFLCFLNEFDAGC